MRSSLLTLLALTSFSAFTASAATIKLKNGTVIVGAVKSETSETIVINADLIGEISVARSDVESTSTASASGTTKAASVQAATAPTPMEVAQAESAKNPHAPVWKRIFSISGNYSSPSYKQGTLGPGIPAGAPSTGAALGLQGETSNYNMSATVLRITPAQLWEFNANYAKATYEPAGTVADAYSGTLKFTQILSDQNYWLSQTFYSVDKISNIDHDFEQIFGYGFKIVDTERTKFDLIPGIALTEFKKGSVYDGDWNIAAGFLERFEYHFNERVSMVQRLKYRVAVEETDNWNLLAEVTIKAALTDNIALNLTAKYDYDNVLGPIPTTVLAGYGSLGALYTGFTPAEKGRLTLQSGVQFEF
ncbi:DUF481 domain-containing protein [Synoicihabitans lomoniglobus]|uniref:DUF481 domain-containing protein n=1 Tax=Synoicihabitans lomoniglobus TaxID=2909285 RepID=A0AAE9ZYY2_9BACT|nr:DUF481 domain-containing protein [Opitutaceae bacterium LMO-M01]WED65695.1 DUF481 domain-containing protein [Opitutaceae bacterium LMO-M01]